MANRKGRKTGRKATSQINRTPTTLLVQRQYGQSYVVDPRNLTASFNGRLFQYKLVGPVEVKVNVETAKA